MAVTYTRISERNYVYIILEVLSFYFVENTLRTNKITSSMKSISVFQHSELRRKLSKSLAN